MMTAICFVFLVGLALVLARFLYKSWWYPVSLQLLMKSQGIKGPPYKAPNWNYAKGVLDMEVKSTSAPMEISHDIIPRLFPQVYSWINLYGKNFLHWIDTQPQLVVTDINLIKEILSDKEGSFDKVQLEGVLKKFLGGGIVFEEGKKWSKLRKVANHAFHGQNLKEKVPAMVASVEELLKTWKSYEGKEIEVFKEFKLLSLEIISKSVFGSDYLTGKTMYHMLDEIVLICYKIIADKFSKSSHELKVADHILQAFVDSLVGIMKQREDKVKAGQSNNFGSDFLGSLMESHHNTDQNKRISVVEIIEECKTFYFAGHETVRSVLSWSILLLAVHTDWQDTARKEVLEMLGQGNPNIESISRLKTVGMILNETLRLYPPLVFLHRKVKRNIKLGELRLPAGMEVYIASLAVHHNSEIWGEDTHLFKPERFAEGVAKATRDQLMAFLSFGFGLRKCVGFNFAQMEVKIALCMILQRYRFTVSPNYRHFPTLVMGLWPKHGIQIMLHPL
uniref:Cytochrome P450 monooxygenase n=1 Tax=Petunia hybrida TaxID=4102 RepID=B3RFJ8_PETHY|nr:cytochrome P450 monooxygenase [Petunia x hybrida]